MRYNMKAILADKHLRRDMMVRVIAATQAREGIATSREQAEAAYEAAEKRHRKKTIAS